MNFKYICVLILVTIISQGACRQEPSRPKLMILVDSLISNTRMDGNQPIVADYIKFPVMHDSASIDELKALAEHRNAIIRYYALGALASRKDSSILPIFIKHLNDNTEIIAGGGHYYLRSPIAAFVADDFLNRYFKNNPNYISQYSIIRNLTKQKEVPTAIVRLALYKNENDIAFLKARITEMLSEGSITKGGRPYYPGYALDAIHEFPSPEFFPILLRTERLMNTHPLWWGALIQYHTKEALDLTLRNLQQSDKDKEWSVKQGITIALLKYPENENFFREVEEKIVMNLNSFRIALYRTK